MPCDFCSWGDPIWVYPATDFDTDDFHVGDTNFIMRSYKDWATCWWCSELIETENLEELAKRAFASAIPEHMANRLTMAQKDRIMKWIRDMHIHFMRNRTGQRRALE